MATVPPLVYVRGTLRGAWRGSEVWSPFAAAESMVPAASWRKLGETLAAR